MLVCCTHKRMHACPMEADMNYVLPLFLLCAIACSSKMVYAFEKDIIATSSGDLEITFIGHGSLMMKVNNIVVHVDPYGALADYALLPKADVLLITHEHRDHLDPGAIDKIRTADTKVYLSAACAEKLSGGTIMKNGDTESVSGIGIEAVPAYNLVHRRDSGEPYHPKGRGNGYVLTVGGKRLYIAGDTENIPEMKALKNIEIAFLPMNLPYTMTPDMVADAARTFKPHILYPYHYGDTDTSLIVKLLKNDAGIDVRIRRMK